MRRIVTLAIVVVAIAGCKTSGSPKSGVDSTAVRVASTSVAVTPTTKASASASSTASTSAATACAIPSTPLTVGTWSVLLVSFDRSADDLKAPLPGTRTMAAKLMITTTEADDPYYLAIDLVTTDDRNFHAFDLLDDAVLHNPLETGKSLEYTVVFPIPVEHIDRPLTLKFVDRGGSKGGSDSVPFC